MKHKNFEKYNDDPNNDSGLILGKKIYTTIKNNKFISYVVIGDRDIGKSTYTLLALYEAFLRLGYRDGHDDLELDNDYTFSYYNNVDDGDPTAWWMALSCIKFRIPTIMNYLNEGIDLYKETRIKKPALCWDDMRKYGTGLNYFLDKNLYNEISGLLDTIKIPINVFLGTCPNMKGVMSIIQNYDSYQINLGYSTYGGDYRIAKCYLWKTSPMGQRTLYPKFRDTFYCRLPNPVWLKYEEQRILVSKESIEGVKKADQKTKRNKET